MTPHPFVPSGAIFDEAFVESLGPLERVALRYLAEAWLRPEQVIPQYDWHYLGYHCGRGFGKTLGIGSYINAEVYKGRAKHVGLMAPTDDRVDEVQRTTLIDTAPPWFRPAKTKGGLRWPNGVEAIGFTPLVPGQSRSENLDLTWLTEIVAWQATTRLEAFHNITTATRVGRSQVIWDTTSKGRNEVIEALWALHDADPYTYPIVEGEIFDNPLLSEKYLHGECHKYAGQRFAEELRGKRFTGVQGACWETVWIDTHRATIPPTDPEVVIVSIDPAKSARRDADEVGFAVGARVHGHAYLLEDLTARMRPEEYGALAIEQYFKHPRCAGAVVERNNLGDHAEFVLRACARERSLELRVVPHDQPFPSRTPGVYWYREHLSRDGKQTRAGGPAAETKHGRVHLVGHFDALETQLTTWVPGDKSPNALDAFVYLVIELLELAEERPAAAKQADVDATAKAHEALRATLAHASIRAGRGRMGTR